MKKGDSLWKIAARYLGDGSRYKEIMTLNSLTSTTIHPGLVLRISGTNTKVNKAAKKTKKTKTYTVKKGDTLWGIAEKNLKNGSRYVEIMSLSKITSTTIHAGQVLTLPGKKNTIQMSILLADIGGHLGAKILHSISYSMQYEMPKSGLKPSFFNYIHS